MNLTRTLNLRKRKKNRDNVNLANLESEIRVTKEKIAALSQGKEFHEERMAAVNAEMEEARKEKKKNTKKTRKNGLQPFPRWKSRKKKNRKR